MPRVKKAKGKKVDMSKLTENQVWGLVRDQAINPHDMFSKAAACSGSHPQTATATLAGMATIFLTELENKGLFFLPGFGLFTKKVTPKQEGYMKLVFGKFRPVRPVQAKVEVEFVPFSQITEHLCATVRMKEAAPVQPQDNQQQSAGAASSSGASGSAGDKPAEHHTAAPSVIIAGDTVDDSDSDDAMGSWSDDGADPAPAPALSSGSD